jgi:hypothetical protein
MSYNSLEFAYKRGIEAFILLLNLLTLNKPKAVRVCIDSLKLQTMTAFNQKLLRGVQGGGFLEKSPPGRRRHK